MTLELISKWQSVGFTHGEVSTVIVPYLEYCLFDVILLLLVLFAAILFTA